MTEAQAIRWIIDDLESKINIAQTQLEIYEKRKADPSLSKESHYIATQKVLMFRAQLIKNTEKLLAFFKIARRIEEATGECELITLN
jgi:hypothetical protein